MPVRPTIPTKEVKTPDTGITVTVKERLTYGESKSIFAEIFSQVEYDTKDAKPESKVTLPQAQNMTSRTLEKAVLAWDVTEEDGSATPVTLENMEEIFTEDDIAFILNHVKKPDNEKKNKSADS